MNDINNKPRRLCFEVQLTSVKGTPMSELCFEVKFFVYGHPKAVLFTRETLTNVEGRYYALMDERTFVDGNLFCEAYVKDVVMRVNTGYVIGGHCACGQATTDTSGGYTLVVNRVEKPSSSTTAEIIAEELHGEKMHLPELLADRAVADEAGNRITDTYVTRHGLTNHIKATYNEQFLENPPLITDGYITPAMLSEDTKNLLEAAGTEVTNLPDGEDLESVHGVLKLANKEYNPNSYDGLGRQYVRRNVVNGVNTLVQSMMKWSNTLYIIRYDHDLQGRTITIPEGCTLMFESGKIYNGKLVLNDTQVRPYGCLLKDYIDCEIEGTFRKGQVLYSEEYKQTVVWTGEKWKCSYSVLFRVYENKLQQSVDDGETWEDVSDYIASYFRFVASPNQNSVGKIQISQDNKTWTDLSPEFTNYMRIADYVATTAELPKNAPQGIIYGVGPVDGSYTLYVNTSKGWINNGSFASFTAGVVQETGDNENAVMSQKAVTEKFNEQEVKLAELGSKLVQLDGWGKSVEDAGITEIGQIYYNSVTKELRKITTVGLDYEIIPFIKDTIYVYKNIIYIYNGNGLIEYNSDRYRKYDLLTSSNNVKGVNHIYPKFSMGMYNTSGVFNEDGTPILDSNYTRFTSELIYCTGGKIKVTCADGYSWGLHMFSPYSVVSNTGWKQSGEEVELKGSCFSICIKNGETRVTYQDLINSNINIEFVGEAIPTLAFSWQMNTVIEDLNKRISTNGLVLHSSMFKNGTYTTGGVIDDSDKIDGMSIVTKTSIEVLPHTKYKLVFGNKQYKVAYWGYDANGVLIEDDWGWYADRIEINIKYATKLNIGLRLESGLYVSDYKDFPILIQDNQVFQTYTSSSFSKITSFNSIEFEKDTIYPNIDGHGFIVSSTSGPRYSIGVKHCGGGKIKTRINSGYRYAVIRYSDNEVFDSGWQTDEKEWELSTSRAFNVIISKTDNSSFIASDAGLVIDVLNPLYPTLANQEQVHYLKDKLDKVESTFVNTNVYPVNSPFNYGHLFIDKIYNDSVVTIPCQSKFDVLATYKCGMRMIELNVLLTSDGVPVCGHQNGTNILTTLTDLQGTPVSVNIAETTFADLRANYRYNSIFPQYRTPITSLEEALLECSKYNMTPFVTYINDDVEELIQSIVGQRYVSYGGVRRKVKTTITEYKRGTVDELVERCKEVGAPYMLGVSLFSLREMSDEELKELVKGVHQAGCWIGWAGCYHTPIENEKYRSLGFDYNASGWDVEDFEHGNIVDVFSDSVKGFDDIKVDSGSLEVKNGCAVLKGNSGFQLGLENPQGIVTKGSLHIHYKGTLNISMGSHIRHSFTKDNEELVLTTIYENENPSCYIWNSADNGDAEIYSISFKVASVV